MLFNHSKRKNSLLSIKKIIQITLRILILYHNPRSLNFIFCLIQVIHNNELTKLITFIIN